jgi:hypothetical protein
MDLEGFALQKSGDPGHTVRRADYLSESTLSATPELQGPLRNTAATVKNFA